ncbi:DNA-binding protein [Candidatus Woesearchaeota archaeon CG10_big_fil_rev_8_21_14_0_10_30_7]|nr:MAG: DNA-binding protein [Candidatus Woesearchaeota archaeon CG10_big_fil_rev_8_21_14_0_10_30_7]
MQMEIQQKKKEEYAIVLDFLPHGYPFDKTPSHKKTSIVQAIGKNKFVLLELVPKKEAFLRPYQEVYIGEGKRDEIHHIIGKLEIAKLTATARSELDFIVKDLVKKQEKFFVEFFNKAQPLTTRMHQLELLPGLGKKHMWEIIEERQHKPFENFENIKKRVKLMPDPEKIIVKRILDEISGKEKHKIFTE